MKGYHRRKRKSVMGFEEGGGRGGGEGRGLDETADDFKVTFQKTWGGYFFLLMSCQIKGK